jgi:MFS family permease
MGNGLVIPMMIALISDRCNPKERGKVFSFCISGFDVGMALGGPILGSVANVFGYRIIFEIAAGLSIIAFWIFVTFSNKNFRNSLGFAMGKVDDLYKI